MALKASHPCFCAYNRTMDLRTPRNVKLTAFFRRSFAFRTIRDRLPVILTKTIDRLSQKKDDIAREYGTEARDEIKTVVGKLSRLKYEIQTNKPLKNIRSPATDATIYNDYIRERDGMEGVPTPFHTIWLLVECYMYRKIWEAFEKTKYLREFDPFRFSKEELFQSALPQIKETIAHLQKLSGNPLANKEDFCSLLEVNLWSNKGDLSLSPDGVQPILAAQLGQLSKNILINDSEKVWNALQSSDGDTIDIVLDNGGAELIADLVLADYLMSKGVCKKVIFHCKKIPWYISDVNMQDVKWTLDQLCKMYEDPALQQTGDLWSKNFDSHLWILRTSDFWTLPVDFAMMHKYDRMLYDDLSQSKMIFVKGDASYRKVFRELYHNPETTLADAQGFFGPSKMCCVRILKSEIICGFPKGLADKCEEQNAKWMEIGEYGTIQFTDKVVPLMGEDDLHMLSFGTPRKEDSALSGWSGPPMPDIGAVCLCRN
ncbi:damage-control phosphatase ARMT1-like isoform X1 [Harmonia axyridis]|uniref:damage-control phosphatase ARMT1-like isoform X1 n=1 Tax=Harmonia axyridis TaxID=115357 RepID=UPI001E27517F|nr:damage-control phosphatase ARMT1-like isoform X1 [Harmonia axyridis]